MQTVVPNGFFFVACNSNYVWSTSSFCHEALHYVLKLIFGVTLCCIAGMGK